MKTFLHRLRRALWVFALLLLFVCEGSEGGIAQARAANVASLSSLSQSLLARRKKKKKHRRKRNKRKKHRRKRKKQKAVVSQAMAVLPFAGDGGGQAMSQALAMELPALNFVDAYQADMALTPGSQRFSKKSIKAALKAIGGTVLLRGQGQRQGDRVTLHVYAFDKKGILRWKQVYQSAPGERDPLALAPALAQDLKKVLPGLGKAKAIDDPEARSRDLHPTLDPVADTGRSDGASAASDNATSDTIVSKADAPAASGVDENPAADTGSQVPLTNAKDAEEPFKLGLSVALGADLLYWSYSLESPNFSNNINAHPLDPYPGGSLALAWQPLPWLAVDGDLHLGQHSFDTSAATIDQDQVAITVMSLGASLRGFYVFDFGLGLGAHLTYRFDQHWASEQSPYTIASNSGLQRIMPGLDLNYFGLAPWLELRSGLSWAPLGWYSETPAEPGQSSELWGLRTDFSARSTLWQGLFVELRAFWEQSNVQYQGSGERLDLNGQAISEAAIVDGLSGLSLGAGWTF